MADPARLNLRSSIFNRRSSICWGEILRAAEVFFGGEIPAFGEDALQAGDDRALHAQVRVAPESKPGDPSQVFIADVQSAGKSDSAVHDQDFAMVAHVDLN